MSEDSDGRHTQQQTAVVPTGPTEWQTTRRELRRFALEIVDGPGTGTRFTASAEKCAIGAHPSNDLVIEDDTVSRFHCEVSATEDGARIRDLESRNGTVVDGVRVIEAWLREGSRITVGRVTLRFQISSDTIQLPLAKEDSYGELVGRSAAMRGVFALLARCAATDITVLLEGETGTGKEGAAEAIHSNSGRADGPFVVVDCGSIPENLIESELFGHEKGAFTGAHSQRVGAFEEAHGGTVFLDEIGELPTDLQPRLLRVLEQKTIRRLGSNQRRKVDVRVVAATNRDLRTQVNEGHFRSDLYYRLAVVKVVLPPLRTRSEDLPLLTRSLLERIGAPEEQIERFTASSFLERLRFAAWAGNVRELRNYLERCLVLDGAAPLDGIQSAPPQPRGAAEAEAGLSYAEARSRALAEFERSFVSTLLARHDGNVSRAARAAGMDRVYFHRLLRRHQVR